MLERKPDSRHAWYIINRRQHRRLDRHVPIKVLNTIDQNDKSVETAETCDVSATGVCLLLASPVEVGELICISANEAELKAHMAGFEVRWTRPFDNHFLVGAELDIPSYKWQLDSM